MSDIESILDDLEKCQEESSVDPDITDDLPNASDDIPINTESRALSLNKKRNITSNSPLNVNSSNPSENNAFKFNGSSPFINNNSLAPPEVAGSPMSPSSPSGKLVSSPIRMNGHVNGLGGSTTVMAKSPVIDRTSFPFPSHFREASDSVDSESSSMSVSSPGHKTPGSINLMQQRVNGVSRNHGDKHSVSSLRNHGDENDVDRSPQMRRGNFRRGLNAVEHEFDLSDDLTRDQHGLRQQRPVSNRSRSVSFDSVIDSDDTADLKDRRPNDVETFHALIQNTRGTRRALYTRGDNNNYINKRLSKSEETLQLSGKGHESREIFSMELDTDTNSVLSDRPRDSDVTSGISSSSSNQEGRLQNNGKPKTPVTRRKLKSEYLANLKNLQASSC